MDNPLPSNQATLSSPFNSLEKVNATLYLPSFLTRPNMEDLANEVRRIIRNLNLGSKMDLLLEEMPLNYHPTQTIGKKKYKGEVVLAHSRYHQENPTVPCTIYQHFVPLNIDAILQQRRTTEGLLLCNNSPKTSIDTHAFVKAWCKGHFHPGCSYPRDYQEQNQDLQVKQRTLDRWFQGLEHNLPKKKEQDDEPNHFPSFHWCERDDIRDPCKICQQVLPIDTDTTWKPTPWDTTWGSVTCQRCKDTGCVIPPDEHCCGLCQTHPLSVDDDDCH